MMSEVKFRLKKAQGYKVRFLLDMMYKPVEIAEQLGVSVDTVYRSYLPAGAPNQMDKAGRVWIYGPAFASWAKAYLMEKQNRKPVVMMAESEAWCLKCNHPVAILGPKRRDVKKRVQRLTGHCPECGKVVNRFVTGNLNRDPGKERQGLGILTRTTRSKVDQPG